MKIKHLETKREKFLYLITFLVVFVTDTLLFATNSNRFFIQLNRFGIVGLALAMLCYFLMIKREQVNPWMILITFSLCCSVLVSGRLSNGYFYYTVMACLWVGYLFGKRYSLEEFAEAFCNIMRIVAIVSLIFWLLTDVVVKLDFLPEIINSKDVKYKTIFLTNVPMAANLSERNMGPFWEPGVYQVYLNLAIYFCLFVKKNARFRLFDCALFVTTCLTTLSGAALIPMVLLIFAYLLEIRHIRSLIFAVLLLALLLLLLQTGMFDAIFDKMDNSYGTNSVTYRWIGMEGSWKGFLKNPIFGSSPETNELIKSELAMKYLSQQYASNTNTFLNFFAYFGFLVGGFVLYGSFQSFRSVCRSVFSSVLVFAAYFVSTSNENLMTSLLIAVLVFLRSGTKEEEPLNETG